MSALGQRTTGEGRIYLTGGSTAIMYGWRTSTIDVDIKADPEPAGFFEAIARIKDDLDLNVELAAPDQFIPPLPGWQDRSIFITREGGLSFYHYDLYSQALSKIERGHERDISDVEAMIQRHLILPGRLQELFHSIEASLIRYPAITPEAFKAAVQTFCFRHSLS